MMGRLDGTKLVVAVIASFFLLVAGAQAFHWHLGYGQAKHSSKEFAEAACKHEHLCTGFGVGSCSALRIAVLTVKSAFSMATSPSPEKKPSAT
jgi:hypothetical protein